MMIWYCRISFKFGFVSKNESRRLIAFPLIASGCSRNLSTVGKFLKVDIKTLVPGTIVLQNSPQAFERKTLVGGRVLITEVYLKNSVPF